MNEHIDLTLTTAVLDSTGNPLFAQGYMVRKLSRFITKKATDSMIPVPVFYNPITKEILIDLVPEDMKEDCKEYNNNLNIKLDCNEKCQ